MRIFFSTLLFLLTNSIIFGQTITGKVVNNYNQPIQEAYILNKNTDHHTHSNEQGEFTLENCFLGDTLQISIIGFQTEIITIKDLKNPLAILLNEKVISLDEVIISPKIDALHIITDIDIQTNPVNSSQDIMRSVPGLFIGQHAGGGKAEQIFLRGFDIDHGTDINVSVDGLPVNMVSHAHGQGYADLHFVIPETVEKIDFGKGPYYEDKGNFTTAGYVDFSTKQKLKNSSVKFEAGQFDTYRLLGMFNLLESNKQNAYIATEFLSTDGYFDSPQNFNRINLFGRYTGKVNNNDKIGVIASYFDSNWDASGQVPQRAVDSGLISRFGAIDDTEGGTTSRTNFNLEFTKQVADHTILKTNVFYSNYNFELYSNFTFFLEDPINGDQLKQKENRDIFGANTAFLTETFLGETPLKIDYGLGLRHDISNDNELSKTINKTSINERVQLGDINQTNIDGFINVKFEFGAFIVAPAFRFDYFKFLYSDKLQNSGKTLFETKSIVSPKLNFFYNANTNLQWFLKSGIGFHSNDTRVVVTNQEENILPRAYGVDFGNIWKPTPNLVINTAAWYLFLEQEFVYVGDAGIVEPSGKTERLGLDFGLRYQFNDWLFFDTDVTLTKARSVNDPEGQNYIPLAPDFTMAGGLSIKDIKDFSGSIKYRYIDDRPANEDNSIVADGYLVTDLNANYSLNKNVTLGVVIENLFDTQWNETQFATESRLQNETQPVEEIHFTPGTPFFIKGSITYTF